MIETQICSKMLVSNWCVATTLTLHGSAGRTPTPVLKIRLDSKSSLYIDLSCFPTCVSHSDVTAKMEEEKLWSKLEHARGPNVPPL